MSVRFNDIIFIDFDKECDDVCNMGKSVSEVSKVNAEADLIGKAENGDMEAQIQLGRLYQHKNNIKNALKYYEMASKNNSKEAIRLMAETYAKAQQYDKSIECYERLIQMGNKRLYLEIGKLYLRQNNRDKAIYYLLKSKEHGNKEAATLLSRIDYPTNVKILEETAMLESDKQAAIRLGNYYYHTDKIKAAYWYHYAYTVRKTTQLNNKQIISIFGDVKYSLEKIRKAEEAQQRLPLQFLEQGYNRTLKEIEEYESIPNRIRDSGQILALGERYKSIGDYTQALKYFYQAVYLGETEAEVGIASVLMRIGDVYSGMFWLTKSAQKDNLRALNYLSQIYSEMNDIDKLKTCYMKMFELGNNAVCLKLACLYKAEMEVDKALYFYEKAIEYEKSSINVVWGGKSKNDIRNMEGEIKKLRALNNLASQQIERLELIHKKYANYSVASAIKLGSIYFGGIGIERNYEKSAYWYNKASEKTIF